MKILVVGSSGLVGSKILDRLSKKFKLTGTFYSDNSKTRTYKNVFHLDVRKHKVVEKVLFDFNPDAVVYAASISSPLECENNPENAYDVNFEALKNIASICDSLKKKVVYISSDYVFDGKKSSYSESDLANPVGVLGKSKRKAEEFLINSIQDYVIIRSSMVFGYSEYTEGRGLLNSLLRSFSKGESVELDAVTPRFPVLADDIADILEELIQRDERGIFHVGGSEEYTKFEFAQLVAKFFQADLNLVKGFDPKDRSDGVNRPYKVRLENKKVFSIGKSVTSVERAIEIDKKQRGCLFRMIYSVRPDMLVLGKNASEFRIKAGRELAVEAPLDESVDCIIPIPESGIYCATGFAAETKKPLFFGIIRDYFTEKTLYSATMESRYQSLKRKLIIVESVVKNKSIALVDEAVISGATMKVIIEGLREKGVREIHVRVPSPIMDSFCDGKVLPNKKLVYDEISENNELKTKEDVEDALAVHFDVESFKFLSHKKFLKVASDDPLACDSCFMKQ